MTFDSEPPAMFGPDVWTLDDKAEAYYELRRRANDMGFLTVGEALDRLECAKLWNAPVAKDWFGRALEPLRKREGRFSLNVGGAVTPEEIQNQLDKTAE